MSNDEIWNELSKVYNMPDVPDEAKEIIGNLMLTLGDDSLIVSPFLDKLRLLGISHRGVRCSLHMTVKCPYCAEHREIGGSSARGNSR